MDAPEVIRRSRPARLDRGAHARRRGAAVSAVLPPNARRPDTPTASLTIAVTRAADHTQAIVNPRINAMLHYAVVFFVIALSAAVFGFGGIAASAVGIAKILFVVFAVLAVASFLVGLLKRA